MGEGWGGAGLLFMKVELHGTGTKSPPSSTLLPPCYFWDLGQITKDPVSSPLLPCTPCMAGLGVRAEFQQLGNYSHSGLYRAFQVTVFERVSKKSPHLP